MKSRQGRPKTTAASYARLTFRLPQDVLDYVRQRSQATGAPINTELVRLVRLGMALQQERDQAVT